MLTRKHYVITYLTIAVMCAVVFALFWTAVMHAALFIDRLFNPFQP